MTAPRNTHMQTHLIETVREKLLLERITLNGVDVNIRDEAGCNALYWAIKKCSTHNANLLMFFGSSLMVTKHLHALFHAIECRHHEMLVLLIDKGLDVNITDNYGKTLLMYAIESEMFESVRYLIQKGADMYLLDDALNMAEDYAKDCNCNLIQSYLKHIVYADTHEDSYNQKLCKCG